jgi:hypothetical protein
LRGFKAELDGGLVRRLAEGGEQVPDFFFAGVDDLPGRGAVDGGGDVLAELFKAAAQLVKEVLGGELGLAVHGGNSGKGEEEPRTPTRPLRLLSGG